ncbi:DcaP family trimeric outer membrane transporter [bacterium]|nr:DcaP family trimeric outer membrane transporter [bacterium]
MRDNLSSTASVALAAVLFLYSGFTWAASDSERIRTLEMLVEQQQKMLESMNIELQRLKTGQTGMVEDVVMVDETIIEPVNEEKARTDISMEVYGFVRADAIYDFKRVDPDWNDTLRVSTIPTKSGAYGNDGESIFSVRQSRLGVKGDYGPDVTYLLEAELFGVGSDQGQTTPRLRHAWGTYKNFGMGQTWSNFMDPGVFPNTIDYWGPTGMVFYRNQQARYSMPLDEDMLSFSLEDPGTALTVGRFRNVNACELSDPEPGCGSTESTAGEIFQAHNDLPDFTASYQNNGDFGHYKLAGIVRKLGYERLDNGDDSYKVGWGINTSAVLNTWGQDNVKLQAVYGEGVGNYMNDGGVDIAPDSADLARAGAATVPLLGLVAYYDHYWNERWSTSFGWSMTDLDTQDGQAGNEFERGQIAQINLLHYPVDNVMMGGEFIWGQRENIDGNKGSDYRVQFSLQVNFDSGNLFER